MRTITLAYLYVRPEWLYKSVMIISHTLKIVRTKTTMIQLACNDQTFFMIRACEPLQVP